MWKVLLYSLLLVAGLVGSQVLPAGAGPIVTLATQVALAFIMIHVGYEFELDRSTPGRYAKDFAVAVAASALPWLLCAVYFHTVMSVGKLPWTSSLLEGLFAAPTSAGVLFSMLAAAGLAGSWVFSKARLLAIFDDLSTLLLLVPLKIMIIGLHPDLIAIVAVMLVLLVIAWTLLHRVPLPIGWPFVIVYSVVLVLVCAAARQWAEVELEVLLPAFSLGCILKRPPGADPHRGESREGHEEGPETPVEQHVATVVSAAFMVLVGLSMPKIFTAHRAGGTSWSMLAAHVLAITALSNLGKLFLAFFYRREATLRQRLALAVGMFPRGEVGAGVLVIGLSYGIAGDTLTVAVVALTVNLLCTGVFIVAVKRLLRSEISPAAA